jgi:chloramphenicol-sensitive protein RarD
MNCRSFNLFHWFRLLPRNISYLTTIYGAFPWIAITLALSFGFYGLLRKTGSLGSTEGLSLETAVYFLPAVSYLLYLNANGTGSFDNSDPRTTLLLIGTGVVTGIPLLLFGAAAKRITMTNLGLLQYIAPTMQFLLAVFVYNESFSRDQLVGFAFIWLALIVYSMEGLRHNRSKDNTSALNEAPITVD